MQLLEFLKLTRQHPPPTHGTLHARIHAEVAALGEERVEYLTAFAGLLARAAFADSEIAPEEQHAIADVLCAHAGLDRREADLIAEITRNAAETLGDAEDYLLTRAFNERATVEQKDDLIDCLYAVAGADGVISSSEDDEIKRIATALLVPHSRVLEIRHPHRDRLAVLRDPTSR